MRPYILVNVAVSADGKLSTRERRQVKISGTDDFARVDIIKSGADAIMVGIGTILADDPSLTVKSPERIADRLSTGRPEHPIRIIIDSKARTPPNAKILHKGPGKRIVAVSSAAPEERIAALSPHAEIISTGSEEVDLVVLMEKLGSQGIKRLMVEGGGTLIAGLFNAGLVDQLSMFIGNIIIGGSSAPTLADGPGWTQETDFTKLELMQIQQLDQGVQIDWRVRR
ncbi:2,5-diamino-6-(ribosylamino)-4(3H)-pyrimidinone 5'-phosphate reductase [Methanospirillum lacunae]|uniref:2,5-diamino-6-(ribosylamino)-4(3H)-pyrimidinone 5'-phosphate reductase n=1 Tax=Methanospirillum lacunae TaxID=668570 RepID=A0A2V2MVT2_9EURY|nr:2,5-diamino-6-(ribosylamino)-4(3H)-pyrimidinone 5'-phosphate reductase [Methanospirillum lacunae]PWR71992.1 2,5-diamino-6-(ribosylamino)-4(3H)-pyrimidinone 5'-phosphate reductase [Methanospirillum lacunae]